MSDSRRKVVRSEWWAQLLGRFSNVILRVAALPAMTAEDEIFHRRSIRIMEELYSDMEGQTFASPDALPASVGWEMDDWEQTVWGFCVTLIASASKRVWGDHWLLPRSLYNEHESVLLIPMPDKVTPEAVINAILEGYHLSDRSRCSRSFQERHCDLCSLISHDLAPDLGNVRVIGHRSSAHVGSNIRHTALLEDVLTQIRKHREHQLLDLTPVRLTEAEE